jgi:hypothetical protein
MRGSAPRSHSRWCFPAIMTLALLVAGCGGSSSSSQPPQTSGQNVLVFGGGDGELSSGGIGLETLDTAEVYDPTENEFEPTGNMADNRALFATSPLANQEVLVAGGSQLKFSFSQIASIQTLDTAQIYDPADGEFQIIGGRLNTARMLANASALPDNDQVLISGGAQLNFALGSTVTLGTPATLGAAMLLNSSELFNESTETFTPGPAMTEARILNTATTLSNGNVLLTGGITLDPTSLVTVSNTAEVYNSSTNTFAATNGKMTVDRALQTANLLPNGQVLIAGGIGLAQSTWTSTGIAIGPEAASLAGLVNDLTLASVPVPFILSTAELYNPSTGQFTATGSMTDTRIGYTATTLQNGQVLIAGGLALTISTGTPPTNTLTDLLSSLLGLPLPGVALTSLNTAMIYDPTTGKFTALDNKMVSDRALQSAVLLENGEVLITGGNSVDIDDTTGVIHFTTLNSAELYNPSTQTFTAAPNMGSKRALQVSVPIPG